MGKKFRHYVAELRGLIVLIHGECERAEARMREVYHLIDQLGEIGIVHDTVVLGQVMHRRYYQARPGGTDTWQLVRAALCVPGGFGVVLWDSDEYGELQDVYEGLEAAAPKRFQRFAECEPALKAMLLPRIVPLLEALFKEML